MSATDIFAHLPKSKLTAKPVLHFVHANGIPAPTYEPLFEIWERFFTLEKIDFLGMDSRYPIDDEWESLTEQVADSIASACKKHSVSSLAAVGHSVGAVTTLQALTMPNYEKYINCAVLLDPSLLMGLRSFGWFLARQTNRLPFVGYELSDKMSPAAKSKHRKDSFSNRDEAYERLRNKGLFKAFDERCFQAYINKGLVDGRDGVSLAISRDIEIAIFRTMPMLYWYKSLNVNKPVTLIAGQDSDFTQMGSYDAVAKRFDIAVMYHQGSHMFPLEYPDSVAKAVLSCIADR